MTFFLSSDAIAVLRRSHSERSEEAVWVGGTNIVQRTTRPHRSLAPLGMTFFLSSEAISVLRRCHSERSEEAVWVGGTNIVQRTTRPHRSLAPLGMTSFLSSDAIAALQVGLVIPSVARKRCGWAARISCSVPPGHT